MGFIISAPPGFLNVERWKLNFGGTGALARPHEAVDRLAGRRQGPEMTTGAHDLWLSGIEHDDFEVRSWSLDLLADETEPGPEVGRRAIGQIDKRGWRGAFLTPSRLAHLPHSEESLNWLDGWLDAERTRPLRIGDVHTLARWMSNAPVAWLQVRLDRLHEWHTAVADAGYDDDFLIIEPLNDCFGRMEDRVALASSTPAELHAELDELLDECGADGELAPSGRFDCVCEELATRGAHDAGTLASWLDVPLGPRGDELTRADRRAAAALIIFEQARMRPPLDALMRLFALESDWIGELVAAALAAGGDQQTLAELLRRFPTVPPAAQSVLVQTLETLRFPGFEPSIAALIATPLNDRLRVQLGFALARYATEPACDAVRRLANEAPYQPDRRELLDLLCVREILTHSETPATRRHLASMHTRTKRLRQLWDDPIHPNLLVRPDFPPHPPFPATSPVVPPPRPTTGRNDPCPCGSGKKFKKCCAQ